MRAQLTYWTQQLRDPLPMLELPADRVRTLASGFRTARQSLQLSPALSEALTHLSRQRGVTLFMTLLAAFDTLLYSYTGQTDFCVATHVANRNRQETEGVLGFFVNTVLLRTDLSGNPTFAEMLWRVRETTLAAHANQDLPFETLLRALEHERPVQRSSLCQVMFLLQNARLQPVHIPGLMLQPLEVDESIQTQHLTLTTFDCMMMLSESPRGLVASCIYQTALFDATTMQRLLDDYRRLLARLVLQPEQPLVRLASRRPSSQTKDDCT
jgi:non-ribosomal peptide synthetase component F